MLRWLWTTLVKLPSEKDAWQFRTLSIAVPVFFFISLYSCSKWFNDYPQLEQARIVEGVFFDDNQPSPRKRFGTGRPYCVKTSTGKLVYGTCAAIYGENCPTRKPWSSYDGSPARMWLANGLAIQMEVGGEIIMSYALHKDLYTKPHIVELLLFPGVLLALLAFMCFRYVPMFGAEAKTLIAKQASEAIR